MSRLTANILLLLAAIVWGAAFVAQSTAMDSIGPLAFIGIRFVLAAMAVAPFAYLEWRKSRDRIPPKGHITGIGVGVIFFAAMALQQYGFFTTTVTNAGFLTALYVVLTPILSILVLRHFPSLFIWPVAALSLSGTYLLAGSLQSMKAGDLLMIGSAFFWALQIIFMGRMVTRYNNPVTVAFVQFLTTGLIGLAAGLIFEPIGLAAIKGAWFELVYTGVISGGLAFTLQAIAQRHTPTTDAAILLSSESLFAALSGAIFLGETLTPRQWLGCLLIFFSILAVELLPTLLKRIRRPQGNPV